MSASEILINSFSFQNIFNHYIKSPRSKSISLIPINGTIIPPNPYNNKFLLSKEDAPMGLY